MKIRHYSLLLISTLTPMAIGGCQNSLEEEQVATLEQVGHGEESVVIGSLDWQFTDDLAANSQAKLNSRFVAHIDIPAVGSRCTGFLINDNIIMTNHHCVSASWMTNGLTADFQYERDVPYYERQRFDCSTFLGSSATLDYALLQCAGNPGQQFGVANLTNLNPNRYDPVYVIHQNCDYYGSPGCAPTKKYSPGTVTSMSSEIRHSADTLGGSSGSPLFSSGSHMVVGIHHAGSGNNGNGRGYHNYAVPMAHIIPDIQSRFPTVQLGGSTGAPTPPDTEPPPPSDLLEPNNTADMATQVTIPFSMLNLRIGQNDIDVFKVQVDDPIELRALIRFSHNEGDLELSVHKDSPSSPALHNATSVNDNEEVSLNIQEAGTYVVVVVGYQGAQADYAIEITSILLHPSSDDPSGTDDPNSTDPNDGDDTLQNDPNDPPASPSDAAYEPNENLSQAALLVFPAALEALEISTDADADFYRFTNETQQRVKIRIVFSHSEGDLDLHFLDENGLLLSSSMGVTDTEEVTTDLAPGSYRIKVYGYSGATAAYSLAVHPE
jgi:V8-like Glu-specific endopeptidase